VPKGILSSSSRPIIISRRAHTPRKHANTQTRTHRQRAADRGGDDGRLELAGCVVSGWVCGCVFFVLGVSVSVSAALKLVPGEYTRP
jgi:hypothetical protein